MINQKRRLLNTLNHIFLTGFFVFCMVAVVGTIGCSDSGGKSKPAYYLSGYDGVSDESSSGEQSLSSAVGNTGLNFYSEFPWFVNLTFQVFDEDMWGEPDLVIENFNVAEDGIDVSQLDSEMNIRRRDFLPSAYSYTIKTVLLLDNTPSTSLNLDKMIEAAQVIVDNMDEKQQQEIAIAAYDESGDFTVVQDFTDSQSLLNEGLINLQPSYGTTNFYGAVIDSLALFEDNHSPASTELVQGFVVAITDGLDTSNLSDVDDAIAARGDKQVITVAVGDLPEQALIDLEDLGNSGYYPVPDPDREADEKAGKKPEDENLCEWMLVIQNQMMAYADSFYWIQYKSTATNSGQDFNHNVTLTIIDNGNEDADSQISGTFSSENFFSGEPNIYFNATAANPDGVENIDIIISRGQKAGDVTSEVTALTFSNEGSSPAQYEWSSGDESVLIVEADSKDSSKATITVVATGETQISVTDTVNNVQQVITVTVKRQTVDYEFIQYVIDSAAPWYADATFQVRDTESENNQWNWVTNLIDEDFIVMENDLPIDFEESEVNIRKRDHLPENFTYAFKTVLLIDNSPSITSEELALIKSAAKEFVYRALTNNLNDDTDGPLLDQEFDELETVFDGHYQQEIAIWTFNGAGDSVLALDFTSDIDDLENTIEAIRSGSGVTDFYGGMVDALNYWENDHSPWDNNTAFVQGAVVAVTDGHDSLPGFTRFDAVLNEIEDRQVFTVGVGDDILSEVSDDLEAFGSAGFYSVSDPGAIIEIETKSDQKTPSPPWPKTYDVEYTALEKTLIDIQDQIVEFANSFYWLEYESFVTPASECKDKEDLEITISNNTNTGAGESVSGRFKSCEFFDGNPGMIYVNYTASNPWGEDGPLELEYYQFNGFKYPSINSIPLEAITYKSDNAPDYNWVTGNENIAVVDVDESSSGNFLATLRLPDNPRAGSTVLRITDRGNGSVFRTLTVIVREVDLASLSPILFYIFDGNAKDLSGNNFDGVVSGARLTEDRFGKENRAYEFDGDNDYIAIKDLFFGEDPTAYLEEIDEISVCAWVKSISDKRQIILSFDRSEYFRFAFNDLLGYGGSSISDENVGWDTTDRSSDTDNLGTGRDYADGAWHFICATFDANANGDNKKIYVDGKLVSSTNAHNGSDIGTGETRYGFVGVGSEAEVFNGKKLNDPGMWNSVFEGVIDDVMMFNNALTESEIDMLYNLQN